MWEEILRYGRIRSKSSEGANTDCSTTLGTAVEIRRNGMMMFGDANVRGIVGVISVI